MKFDIKNPKVTAGRGKYKKLKLRNLMIRPIHPFPKWENSPDSPDLEEWRTSRRIILLDSDDPLVWTILAAHWEMRVLVFKYYGGSALGSIRRIMPDVVFEIEGFSSVWFEGWCPIRKERRTFNGKKMIILENDDLRNDQP